MELVRLLAEHYPQELKNRYPVEALEGEDRANGISMAQAAGILEQIARLRGCLQKGGDTDTAKAASMVLDDFRSGKLGRITLERRECHGAENDRREA